MKTRTKALLLALCAVLLVCASVFGTLAYFTSKDAVTNTFTVGKVVITLDEAKVETNGTPVEDADRVKANAYHLLPGHSYTKDPTIHVDAESEDCWLFVKIDNQIAAIEDAVTVHDQMVTNGWTEIDATNNIYAYKAIATKNQDVKVFDSFKIQGAGLDNDTLADYEGMTIVVTAYAIQADGFATAQDAWTAAGAEAQA